MWPERTAIFQKMYVVDSTEKVLFRLKPARMVLNEIALRKRAYFRSGAGLKRYLKQ